MANSIILKKSSVASKVPLASDLAFGELALNYADGKLYYKQADGVTIGQFSTSGTITPPSAAKMDPIAAALVFGGGGSDALVVNSFNTRTGDILLTSSDVTTALGFTPYNSTNPSGYISANQTITVSGDVTGSGTTAIALTLANSGVTAGTYTYPASIVVDAKGRITSATSGSVVNSLTAGTGITVSGSTGAVTVSIGQAVATSSNVQFNSIGIGTAGSGTAGELRATGTITAFYSSDIKFKTNIKPIPNALNSVLQIGGKLFDWTDDYIQSRGGEDGYFIQKQDFGVIAQDVKKVFPRAVRTRSDGSLAVDYEKLSSLAFAAISELSEEIDMLKDMINTMQEHINVFKK